MSVVVSLTASQRLLVQAVLYEPMMFLWEQHFLFEGGALLLRTVRVLAAVVQPTSASYCLVMKWARCFKVRKEEQAF